MSLSKQDVDAIHDLLCQIWDQGASPQRLAELEATTKRLGPEAYEEVLRFTSLHSDLGSSMSSSRAFESSVAAILGGAPSDDQSAQSTESPSHTPRVVQSRSATASTSQQSVPLQRLSWLALAACLLLAVGYGVLWLTSDSTDGTQHAAQPRELFRPPQPVASIFDDHGAVWSAEHGVNNDNTLMQGQLLELEHGRAQISMASGADVVLQAPCTVRLVADDLVELHSGKITAQAAAWATGFVIETKGLRITDLGTRFAVSADSTGITEAHVLEGSVLAEPMRDIRPKRSSMLLKKGEGIRVSLPQSTIDLIAAKSSEFIDHLPKFRPLRPIQIWNTGLSGTVGQDDLQWMITAGDPANGPYPRPAVITQANPVYLDNMPDASQWISVNSATPWLLQTRYTPSRRGLT